MCAIDTHLKIITDEDYVFFRKKVVEYVESRQIKILIFTPYYAQANGQIEAMNKIAISLIKKLIKENPNN